MLADTTDRKQLIQLSLWVQTVTVALLAGVLLMGWAGPASLLLFTFAAGCCTALLSPAWNLSVADSIPRDELPQAMLDEPVAGMTDEETERTAELFLSLEGNHSLVMVEHDMKFVGALTQGKPNNKVTVLHEGSVLAEGTLADVQANEKVVEVYLGR